MKTETKTALITALELFLAELKEESNPESTTINVPTSHNWVNPTTTFNLPQINDEEIKKVIRRNAEKNVDNIETEIFKGHLSDLREQFLNEEKNFIPEGVHVKGIHTDPYEIPDSEFILPAEIVKSKSKKKK